MDLFSLVRKIVHWMVTVLIVLYIFTGLGITYYNVIEAVTFGWLSKLGAYQLHSLLLVPFIIVLSLHITLSLIQNRQKRNINVA
jgi:cytochrome b subunit of formate dehydrogenase